MKDTIVDLLNSKKFLAAIANIIGVILARVLGMEISDDTLMQIISAISGLYIAAQGAADHGKSAALARYMAESERIEAATIEADKQRAADFAASKVGVPPDPE